jgi:outer membrane receptor protein involved in Fe transport
MLSASFPRSACRAGMLALLSSSCSFLAPSLAHAAPGDASPAAMADTEIIITARRLSEARNGIQTRTGASTYAIDAASIDNQPGGDNNGLNQIVLQAPGVAQDSFGQLHVRGEHNGLQYRLNGIILPEGLNVFSQALNPRLAEKVELITGALPAEYGLRTAGIIDISTKSGLFKPGGSVSIYGGSHDTIQPSFEYAGSSGHFNFFVSGQYLQSRLGIDSPDGRSTPLHDRTRQDQGFAYLEDIVNSDSKVTLILGTSHAIYQIPNVPGQPTDPDGLGLNVKGATDFDSARLNEKQREITHYGALSYLNSGSDLDLQVSLFGRYSSLAFAPDALGDILFTGIAQNAYRRDVAGGVQTEAVYRIAPTHTLRGGVILQLDRTNARTVSGVLAAPIVDPATPITILDDSGKVATSYSLYLQDEWKILPELTLNYGARFDYYRAYRNESQVSPRVNLVWQPTDRTTVHAGYSRYFSPPPFELVANTAIATFIGTTAEPPNLINDPPRAERANYFDIGMSQRVTPELTFGIDAYYKRSRNLIDEGQFGAPIILTPFNYAEGRQYGVELTASYDRGPIHAYGNFAASVAEGRHIVSSQFNFDPADLAYIADHWIHLDHDQTYTGTLGGSYEWRGTRLSADLIYGSGLRSDSATTPNGNSLKDYVQVNFGVAHKFEIPNAGDLELRLDLINAFDAVYQIRNGGGVGVGTSQFGARRGVFVGLTKSF